MDTELLYPWNRRWAKRSSQQSVVNHPRYSSLYSDGVFYEEITQIPCLILLGIPASGKTQAIEAERRTILARSENLDKDLYFDLAICDSPSFFVEHVFKSDGYKNWLLGTHNLYLFLDNLEQGKLDIAIKAALIAEELQNINTAISRLYLRLVCRTADWNVTFESRLKDLYTALAVEHEEPVQVYEL